MIQVEGMLKYSDLKKDEIVMNLEFHDEAEKQIWIETINAEIDQLKSIAFCL